MTLCARFQTFGPFSRVRIHEFAPPVRVALLTSHRSMVPRRDECELSELPQDKR